LVRGRATAAESCVGLLAAIRAGSWRIFPLGWHRNQGNAGAIDAKPTCDWPCPQAFWSKLGRASQAPGSTHFPSPPWDSCARVGLARWIRLLHFTARRRFQWDRVAPASGVRDCRLPGRGVCGGSPTPRRALLSGGASGCHHVATKRRSTWPSPLTVAGGTWPDMRSGSPRLHQGRDPASGTQAFTPVPRTQHGAGISSGPCLRWPGHCLRPCGTGAQPFVETPR
jgi:hypothetical protein